MEREMKRVRGVSGTNIYNIKKNYSFVPRIHVRCGSGMHIPAHIHSHTESKININLIMIFLTNLNLYFKIPHTNF